MNPEIAAYFNGIEQRLLESHVVSGYTVVRREITPTSGKVRLRVRLTDGGLLELFEYVVWETKSGIIKRKYSYHWQGADGAVVRRWDAVAHHPELPYAPHHVHWPNGCVEGVAKPPSVEDVLTQIEGALDK
ncbi:MAG TPA: hypothetical protein ENK08_02865 [Chloroflexi bacterium]|nr:hypothetical protein [Chloroflexota bacterium]